MIDVYGNDINNDWNLENGDIELVKGSSNLGQAILNRLNAYNGDYELFYRVYGGFLFEHMGDLNHPTIHEYIRIEIEDILKQEPRIKNVTATVNKIDRKTISVDLKVVMVQTNEVETYNLVLSDNEGISIEGQTAMIDANRSD